LQHEYTVVEICTVH